MLRVILSFTLGCLIFIGYPVGTIGMISDEQIVENYVDYFHRNMRPRYAKKAKRLVPPLMKYATEYKVDPFRLACIFSLESSWRNFLGKDGEKGPGQVLPHKWALEFDLDTLDGQIKAAAYRWKVAMETCGNLEGALTHYACGSCKSSSKRTRKKMKYRFQYIKKMEKRFVLGN